MYKLDLSGRFWLKARFFPLLVIVILYEDNVYILRSLKNGRYYIGYTKDLKNRLREHNSGETKSTHNFIPYEMVYNDAYENLSEAKARERYIKSQKSRKYIEKLIKVGA